MFRFTIRDLLWLTVVVAMGGGWYAYHVAAWKVYSGLIQGQAERSNGFMKTINYKNDELSKLHTAIEDAGFRVKRAYAPNGEQIGVAIERAPQ